jgi:hypothetical protein
MLEAYSVFIEDYPKNRDKILSGFDQAIQQFEGEKHIQDYFIKVKTAFLDAGEKIEREKVQG